MKLYPFSISVGVLTNDPTSYPTNYRLNQPVYVKDLDGNLASIYSNKDAVVAMTQPAYTNAKGVVTFYTKAGYYTVEATVNGEVETKSISAGTDQGLVFASTSDIEETAWLNSDDIITNTSLASATYKIFPSGTTPQIGDIELNNGQVAVLQPLQDGSWDVRAFGAVDDQSDVLGSQLSYFSLAAQRALLSSCVVTIPVMKVRLSGTALTHDVIWNISSKTVFTNLAGVSPTFVYNMSILGGKINVTRSGVGVGFKYFGDPKYTFQSKTNRTMTTGVLNASSTNGAVSLLGATCTSNNTGTTADQSGIGMTSKVLADNQNTAHSGWGGYDEAIRYNEVQPCNVYGRETSISNGGTSAKVLKPYDTLTLGAKNITGHVISCGLDSFSGPVTAFSYWTRTSASTRAHKGLVIMDESIADGTYLAEAIAMPNNHGFGWYAESNDLGAYIKYINDDAGNSIRLGVFNDTFAQLRTFNVGFSSIKMGNSNVDLGEVTARYKSIYLLNSPDVVSDESKKQNIESLTQNEYDAGLEIARHVKTFKWKDEVLEKGEDGTYKHISVMAQKVWSILEDYNLDPTTYGFISNSSDGWSINRDELNMFVNAAIVNKLDSL